MQNNWNNWNWETFKLMHNFVKFKNSLIFFVSIFDNSNQFLKKFKVISVIIIENKFTTSKEINFMLFLGSKIDYLLMSSM